MAFLGREPDNEYTLDLWEVNHSVKKLEDEEETDYLAYRLGFQMEPSSVDPSKMAYKNFSDEQYPEGNVSEMDFLPNSPVMISFDFNRTPQTCVFLQKSGKRYIVFDEVWNEQCLTYEQGQKVAERLKKWGISHVYLYGDNTSNQKAGSYGRTGRNDWEYIKQALGEAEITFTSKLKKSNPKRKIRVDRVNIVICHPKTGVRRLLIHKRCGRTIRDYIESVVDEQGVKIDTGKIGHISDACDYCIFENEGNSDILYAL